MATTKQSGMDSLWVSYAVKGHLWELAVAWAASNVQRNPVLKRNMQTAIKEHARHYLGRSDWKRVLAMSQEVL